MRECHFEEKREHSFFRAIAAGMGVKAMKPKDLCNKPRFLLFLQRLTFPRSAHLVFTR